MDSNYQADKAKEATKRGVVMLLLVLLCLNIETVFTQTSNTKQQTLLSNEIRSEKERSSTRKTSPVDSQTVFSTDLNNIPDKNGKFTDFELLSTEKVIPVATVRPKTSLRHEKHKLRMEWKKGRNGSKQKKDEKSRRRRIMHHSLGLKQNSCPTRTNYVSKRTAKDIFGDTVDVYPVIHIGELAVDQHFYETFCDVEKCSCAGIDNKKFKSSCQTTHSHTYARVVKNGEIGWSYIKVRSGCSCVVQEKRKTALAAITGLWS